MEDIEATKGTFLAPPIEMARFSSVSQNIPIGAGDFISWDTEDANTGLVELKNSDEIHFSESGLASRTERIYLVTVGIWVD